MSGGVADILVNEPWEGKRSIREVGVRLGTSSPFQSGEALEVGCQLGGDSRLEDPLDDLDLDDVVPRTKAPQLAKTAFGGTLADLADISTGSAPSSSERSRSSLFP
ncbi:MAG TPA: hypothetical protein VGU71_06595 [Candidatus Dormibacteraeota bacterium]|nr:hypothetical protein [Candidatus Dormibacteraeota bacterium]